jgi:hypothetical protein
MPISNITRTNTVDEWRIQTNLSANALNKIETGNYDKISGSLNIACTAVLTITSTGTGLSVANNALVSGDFTVGRSIALGSEGAATGNLTVGANVFIYGRGAALFVANSAIVNVSIQATQSIRTNNFIANTDASITGTAQLGILTVNTNATVGTTLAVVGNTTVGNLVTANSVVGDNGRFSSNVVASHFVTVAGSLVADSARITSNATFGETTATTINTTNARISGNANVAHVTATGSLVADSARIAANATFGETTATTINTTNARISGNANVAHLTASASVVADNARITANTTGAHFIASGSLVADSARIAANATFGETTATTINTTNARISGNANVAHVTATGSIVVNNARISANATFGEETTATTINATNARISGNANVAHLTASSSVVADSARITANTTGAHFIASGSLIADNARITANATFGETTATTINTTNARISDNANVAHVTASGSLVADSARITANATFGETTATTINTTNARISGNANVAHVTASGSLVADSARITANATFGETTATTINATNARISGNANVAHLAASASVGADNLIITNDAGIGGTLRVTGNSVFGNVNTANMMYAGSLRTVGRADVGGAFTVGADASIDGKLTVGGDFVLSGDIVYDTDVLSISTVTPVTTTGAAYYGVFRGNTSGGVTAHNMAPSAVIVNERSYKVNSLGSTLLQWQARFSSLTQIPTVGQIIVATSSGALAGGGLVTDRDSDANAYIRWAASSNTWQIRDVFNSDVGTSYSKILTANLISDSLTSTSTDTFLSSSGAKSLKDSINTEISDRQANVGALNITVTNNYQANVGQLRLDAENANTSLASNIGAARIADTASAQANTGAARLELLANVGAGLITATDAGQANVGAGLLAYQTTSQANTGAARLELLANVGAGLITATDAGQANVGAGLLAYQTTSQANVGAGLLSYQTTSQANVGAGLIALNTSVQANVGAGIITANDNLKNYTNETFLPKTGGTISSDLIISGSLTVSGTVTTINTEEINLADNEIVLNSNHITNVMPTQNAGIIINRGNLANSPNVFILYDEENDYWVLRDNIGQFIIATAANVGAGIILANTNLKNYVDAAIAGKDNTDEITEGSTNLYFTNARARAAVSASGSLSYDSSTGVFSYSTPNSDGISEGSTNLYFTNTRARAAVGVAATFGAPLSYISGNGTFQHLNSGVTATGYGDSVNVPVFIVNATGHVTSVTNTAIRTATTSVTGIVQLTDTEGSTSTTTAATPNAVTTANTKMRNYVDAAIAGKDNTDEITEGSTNLYFTNTRARAAVGVAATFGAPLSYISSNGTFQHLNSGVTATGYGDSVTVPVFVVNGTGHLTSVTNTAIRAATTSVTGIVQLTSSVSSTSTTTAAVPASVKVAYDFAQAAFTAANTVAGTSTNPQFNSIGVGTAASTTAGEIRATADITAGYSDDRLKNKEGNIQSALEKVSSLNGFYYTANEVAQQLGYPSKRQVGISAQEVQNVLPEVVVPAPIDETYLTVQYEKMVPLLIEAIKELKAEIEELKKK